MDASRLHRSVALWRRQARASTADMTRGLLEAMAAEGIVIGDRNDPSAFVAVLQELGYRVTPPPDKSEAAGHALLMRRASELEKSPRVEDQIQGLRLRHAGNWRLTMAYIGYGQNTVGGKQLAELMADAQSVAARFETMAAWVNQIGPSNLESNTDFSAATGQGQALNDTFLQIAAAFATFMGDGSPGTNAEKIARLARGE